MRDLRGIGLGAFLTGLCKRREEMKSLHKIIDTMD